MKGGKSFEDVTVGDVYSTASVTVTADMIKTFAVDYDPQVFHLDELGARDSFFGELVASGWHTTALVMRLLVDADIYDGRPLIGGGVDDLRWPNPMRPGDTVSVRAEVIDKQASRSRPDRGRVRVRIEAFNQSGHQLQTMVANMILPRRAAAPA